MLTIAPHRRGLVRGALARLAYVTMIGATLAGAPTRSEAGAVSSCNEPFFFRETPLNIIIGEYEFAAGSAARADPALRDAAQRSAKRLGLLTKFDLFLNARVGNFAVISALALGDSRRCRSSAMLERLNRMGPRHGTSFIFLTGRIYQEQDAVVFQSELRGGRVSPQGYGDEDTVGYELRSANGAVLRFAAPVLSGPIVFPPRYFTLPDIEQIETSFERVARIYQRKGDRQSVPIPLKPEHDFAFTIQEINPDGWMRINAVGAHTRGWIKTDPLVGRALHRSFPELDFLQGLGGYQLLLARRGAPSRAAGQVVDQAFRAYLENANEKDAARQRSLALRIAGAALTIAGGGSRESWAAARDRFRRAADIDPSSPAVLNLVALADMALCCRGDARPDATAADQVVRQLQDVLAVRPNDRYALQNLELFLDYLGGLGGQNEKYAQMRDKVREVRRTLGQGAN